MKTKIWLGVVCGAFLITDIYASANDTTGVDYEEIMEWLDTLDNPLADYERIDYLLRRDDIEKADLLLEAIPEDYLPLLVLLRLTENSFFHCNRKQHLIFNSQIFSKQFMLL